MVNAYQKRLKRPGASSSSSRSGFLLSCRSEYCERLSSNQSFDRAILRRDQLLTLSIARLACPARSCFICGAPFDACEKENESVEHADFRISGERVVQRIRGPI